MFLFFMIEMLRFRSRILTEDQHDIHTAGESVHRPEFNPDHRRHTHQLEVLGNEISLIIPPMAILVGKLENMITINAYGQ